MKKNIFILSLFITLLSFYSCNKFLEEVPKSQLSPGNFYVTEADALGAINGVYASLGSGNSGTFWHQMMFMTDGVTDDMTIDNAVTNANFRSLIGNYFDANNVVINDVWRDHYAALNRANAVIDRVPLINMNATTRDRIVGEAKFLRAFIYFHLVQLYDRVPLLVNEVVSLDNVNTPQSGVDTIYKQIIQDLKDAETLLPNSYAGSDIGRATRGAAKGLLAKVYLINKEWQLAADKASEIITSGIYQLQSNYRQVFSSFNKNNREILFALQFQSGLGGAFVGRGNLLLINTMSRGGTGSGTVGHFGAGNGLYYPTTNLINSFETGDLRRLMISGTYTLGTITYTFKPVFFKYIDSSWITRANTVPQDGNSNFNFMRYSDVLLIAAEALNELGQGNSLAFTYVNQVRSRAGLAGLPLTLSQVQLRDAIYRERRSEFYAEGQRFYDLKRTNRFLTSVSGVTGKAPQSFQTVFPVPRRELDINPKLIPTFGY